MSRVPVVARRLVPGDVVAVVSTSAGLAAQYPHRTARGIKALESLGYMVEVMPHALGESRWLSGTIEDRVADIHAAFADDRIRAVISTIGGDHSAQLLDSLDFDLIAANPKIFCGYSDVTSLLLALHHLTGLVTFYGPAVLPQFGEWPAPFPETVQHFQAVTTRCEPVGAVPRFDTVVTEFIDWAEDESRPRVRTPAPGRRLVRAGTGEGPLIVGCVPTLRDLVGTRWQPDYRGSVLVLDVPDMGYGVRQLDTDLWHLRNAGLLSGLAALVIGRPKELSDGDIDVLCDVVATVVRPFDYPVVAQFESGHSDPVATLPIGLRATVCGTDLTVTEAAVW